MAAGLALYTIGHGTRPVEALVADLQNAGITSVVDVRRFPGSARNPQYGMEPLAHALAQAGIAYRHEPDLGGRRREAPESSNTGLRHAAFRAYADYMTTPEFRDAFARLLEESSQTPTAILCSETLWWRCHRRLVADATTLLAHRVVTHLINGSQKPHVVTDGAVVLADRLAYPAPA